ncbi:MAG: hypothetical protein PHU56_01750 [Candidatus Pacebacteria bacterium]|nr:hypothetical protein [Candidatus Paceibacterota bacterium]
MLNEILNYLSNPHNIGLALLIVMAAVFLLYGFFIFYHFIRFGVGGKPKILALVFFIGACFLSAITLVAYQKVDWAYVYQAIKDALHVVKPY